MNQIFYKNYNLDASSADEVAKFCNFVADPRSSCLSTPYNLLIDYDNPAEGDSFVNELAQWLARNSQLRKNRVCICSESEIVEHLNILSSWLNPYFACIIEANGSADASQLEQIKNYIEATPSIIFIICTTASDIDRRFRPDEHLFYRVLPYHVHIGDVSGAIMSERLFRMLECNNYSTTDDFKSALIAYNSTVYPKADLKNEAYLQDLFRRVINNHLGSGNTSQIIDVDSVPPYIKPSSEPSTTATMSSKSFDTHSSDALQVPETATSALDVSSLELKEGSLASLPANGNDYNVLFMALSTFPRADATGTIKLDRCTFTLKNDDGTGTAYVYYYQLEPVPRMLSMKLWKESHEHINKLILLCSKETTDNASIIIDGRSASISPCDFLKQRLSCRLAPDTDLDSAIQVIPIDTNQPVAGIRETVRYIRRLKEEHANLHLYVDRHGGFRSIQSSVNAMLSLLKSEVDIRKIYDLTFNTKTKVGTIVEADPHDLYDFVSGINEFTNYGRIKSLDDFYGKDNRNDLMQHIATISEGIQLCDIATFENGISAIKTYFKAKRLATSATEGTAPNSSKADNTTAEDESHAYLALFEDKIYEDYKRILEAKPNRIVLEEIEWCRRKGFFQQALTLIEARMPKELKRCHVYSYDQSLADYVNDRVKSKKFAYQDTNDFIFNQTILYARNDTSLATQVNGQFRKRYIRDGLYKNYLTLSYKSDNQDIATAYCNNAEFKKMKEACEVPGSKRVSFIFRNPHELFAFIHLHAAFKNLRNQANHASKDNIGIPLDAINKALQFYYEHGRNIEEYAERRTRSS